MTTGARCGVRWGLRRVAQRCAFVSGVALAAVSAGRAQVDVLTYHNDVARTGQNLAETVLTPANVNAASFGRLFVRKVDGEVYAQPLCVTGVVVPGKGTHNVVYVVTENDSAYAFDADSAKGPAKKALWKRTLRPKGEKVVTSKDLSCDDLVPKIGITSTPVIDKAGGTLYLVACTRKQDVFIQRLYALTLATGGGQAGRPRRAAGRRARHR